MLSIEEFKNRMLKKWSIRNFRWKIETANEEQKHWQVVLHDVDHNDNIFFLTIATSQITKKKAYIQSRSLPHATLVIVPIGESRYFSLETAFNCNDPIQYGVAQIYAEYIADSSIYKWVMEVSVLNRIMEAIRISPQISKRIKDKILS